MAKKSLDYFSVLTLHDRFLLSRITGQFVGFSSYSAANCCFSSSIRINLEGFFNAMRYLSTFYLLYFVNFQLSSEPLSSYRDRLAFLCTHESECNKSAKKIWGLIFCRTLFVLKCLQSFYYWAFATE